MTIEQAFDLCGLCLHPEYESFFYWPIGDTSDMYWLRWDPNDASEGVTGIQMLDRFEWEPIEKLAGITSDECELLHGQLPNAIPINNLEVDTRVRDKLPGFVQDILSGRFCNVEEANAE